MFIIRNRYVFRSDTDMSFIKRTKSKGRFGSSWLCAYVLPQRKVRLLHLPHQSFVATNIEAFAVMYLLQLTMAGIKSWDKEAEV